MACTFFTVLIFARLFNMNWPMTLLLSAIDAMEKALAEFAAGRVPTQGVADFAHLRDIVGFPEYYELEEQYKA